MSKRSVSPPRWSRGRWLVAVMAVPTVLASPAGAQAPADGLCWNPITSEQHVAASMAECTTDEIWYAPSCVDTVKALAHEAMSQDDCAFGEVFMTGLQLRHFLDNRPQPYIVVEPPAGVFPADWYKSTNPCTDIPGTDPGNISTTSDDENRINSVFYAKETELISQIAYDEGAGVPFVQQALGATLGAARAAAFALDWTYSRLDECQEIMERRSISTIESVANLTQLTLDNFRSEMRDFDTRTQAKLDGTYAALVAHDEQSYRLYIEDHLASCSPILSLILSDDESFLADTFALVVELIERLEGLGFKTNVARLHYAKAERRRSSGELRGAYRSLCDSYQHLTNPS